MTSPEPSANFSTGACAQYRTCARSSSTLALTCPRTPAQLIGWPERAASFRPAKTTWRCSRTAERSRSGTFERRVWGTRRFHGAKHFPPFSREFCSVVHILLTANMFHSLQYHRFRTYQFQVPLVHFLWPECYPFTLELCSCNKNMALNVTIDREILLW